MSRKKWGGIHSYKALMHLTTAHAEEGAIYRVVAMVENIQKFKNIQKCLPSFKLSNFKLFWQSTHIISMLKNAGNYNYQKSHKSIVRKSNT